MLSVSIIGSYLDTEISGIWLSTFGSGNQVATFCNTTVVRFPMDFTLMIRFIEFLVSLKYSRILYELVLASSHFISIFNNQCHHMEQFLCDGTSP